MSCAMPRATHAASRSSSSAPRSPSDSSPPVSSRRLHRTTADLQPTTTARGRTRTAPSTAPPRGRGGDAVTTARDDRTLGELFAELSEKTSTLVKKEIELGRHEMTRSATEMARRSAMIGVGGAIAYAGFIVLL